MDIDLFAMCVGGTPAYNGERLRVRENTQGYMYVTIMGKVYRLHRLVAKKYIPNPRNLPCVDHKDGDKRNNEPSNLQWVTYSSNSKKAFTENPSMRSFHDGAKKVLAVRGDQRLVHESARACARFLERDISAVVRCCQGEWQRCAGWKLSYL